LRSGGDGFRVLEGDHVEGDDPVTRLVRGGHEVGGAG
jgi:hypothetical protein